MKKYLTGIAFLICACLLVGCASGGGDTADGGATGAPEDATLNIVVAARYVGDEALAEYAAAQDLGLPVNWVAVSTGDPDADPMSTMAGMAKITGMMAGGEIDILISDEENALRHGDNGETYLPLSGAFDPDALAAFKRPLITLPIRDEEGAPTGAKTAELGVDMTDDAALLAATSADALGAYIMANAAHADAAQAALEILATR